MEAAHRETGERLLPYFSYEHLPPKLQETSRQFALLAVRLCTTLPSHPERTVALRKLLESKDCAGPRDDRRGLARLRTGSADTWGMLQFRQADADRMKEVERELVRALLPFRENTESALVLFALVRCARVMARVYPAATRDELVRICHAYLKGETAPAGVETDSGILMM